MATGINSNRLLVASKLTHLLWRGQYAGVDLSRLVNDEAYARELIRSVRSTYPDPKVSELLAAFEQTYIDSGAWSTKIEPTAPVYTPNADGTIPAAAAWDPNYNPPTVPPVAQNMQIVRVPTTSARVSTVVKETPEKGSGSSSFFSRFRLSRPNEPSTVPGVDTFQSTQPPTPDPPETPVDPNKKKYLRGAR
jgi:hypothetical protein